MEQVSWLLIAEVRFPSPALCAQISALRGRHRLRRSAQLVAVCPHVCACDGHPAATRFQVDVACGAIVSPLTPVDLQRADDQTNFGLEFFCLLLLRHSARGAAIRLPICGKHLSHVESTAGSGVSHVELCDG